MTTGRTIIVTVAALAVGSACIGYWRYSVSQLKELRSGVVALLKDSGSRVRDGLGMETAPPTVDRSRFVVKLEEHAATAESNYQQLKRLAVARDRPLTDAADDYLLTARELLKKQLESHRQRRLLAESLRALEKHLAADDRSGAWVQAAAKAREQANRDQRAYGLAVQAYVKLLDGFPGSQAKVETHIGKSLLIETGTLADTARQVREESRRVAEEAERIGSLGPAR